MDAIMMGERTLPGLFFQLDTRAATTTISCSTRLRGPSLNYRKSRSSKPTSLFRAWVENPLFERSTRLIDGPIAIYRAVLHDQRERGRTVLPWTGRRPLLGGRSRIPFSRSGRPSTTTDRGRLARSCPAATSGIGHAARWRGSGGAPAPCPSEERSLPLGEGGQAILFTTTCGIGSLVNRTGKTRRAFSVCYRAPKRLHAQKARATRVLRVF